MKATYRVVQVDDEMLDEQVSRVAGTLGKGEERKRSHQQDRGRKAADVLYGERSKDVEYRERWQQFVELMQFSMTDAEEKKNDKWKCERCGQIWYLLGLELPEICDFCGVVTVWKLLR